MHSPAWLGASKSLALTTDTSAVGKLSSILDDSYALASREPDACTSCLEASIARRICSSSSAESLGTGTAFDCQEGGAGEAGGAGGAGAEAEVEIEAGGGAEAVGAGAGIVNECETRLGGVGAVASGWSSEGELCDLGGGEGFLGRAGKLGFWGTGGGTLGSTTVGASDSSKSIRKQRCIAERSKISSVKPKSFWRRYFIRSRRPNCAAVAKAVCPRPSFTPAMQPSEIRKATRGTLPELAAQ
mmetsp:Transcript_18738/g.34706  ORF Transcript_18738/g.34706 Transcript_18738/m.34706 type:complete len:243 (-) Transcript_18738:705-1433(-)